MINFKLYSNCWPRWSRWPCWLAGRLLAFLRLCSDFWLNPEKSLILLSYSWPASQPASKRAMGTSGVDFEIHCSAFHRLWAPLASISKSIVLHFTGYARQRHRFQNKLFCIVRARGKYGCVFFGSVTRTIESYMIIPQENP